MPSRPHNLRSDSDKARDEWAVGSLPVGSWVEMYDLDDVLIYRGVIKRQSPWGGYSVVDPITEGDGNFIGKLEHGTLQRLYKMSEQHYVQEGCPVTWLGVDRELQETIELAAVSRSGAVLGLPSLPSNSVSPISLLPVVSLIVISEEE